MKSFVINLARAEERRRQIETQFSSLGLEVTFHEAIDGKKLMPEHHTQVDRESRRRLGLWPQADGSIANWISQRQVMQEIVDNGPETAAIFEDDAMLSTDLPAVLDALDVRPFSFLLIRDTPSEEVYVLNMFCMRGSRLWGSRLHRACVV